MPKEVCLACAVKGMWCYTAEENDGNFCRGPGCQHLHFLDVLIIGDQEECCKTLRLIPADCNGRSRKLKLSDILERLYAVRETKLIIITLDMCQTLPLRGGKLIDAVEAVLTTSRGGNSFNKVMQRVLHRHPASANQDVLIFTAGERGLPVVDEGLFSRKAGMW